MKYKCPNCRKMVARDGKTETEDGETIEIVIPVRGARLETREREAPRVKCVCGKTVIILKGEP